MDVFSKGFIMGLGLGLTVKEGAEEAASRLAENLGGMAGQARDEAAELARAVSERLSRAERRGRAALHDEVAAFARENGLAGARELDELRARVERLEAALAARDAAAPQPGQGPCAPKDAAAAAGNATLAPEDADNAQVEDQG
ncbi:hypothetical protein dsx2_3355 [Desulfovibrio sp. X2]|uniref:hypothetical protein n=1 Tax=Desulfovibrio sp. X2 TaxID=941449 RepID=UPI000358769A|nr:hypothetical protein [Desulfovibrio sp. X2]EPR40228.1 hypothetical protein dsx2_3355 [Desulfovibrio sp. X2]